MIITENDRKIAGMLMEPCRTFSPEVVALAQETGLRPSSVKQYLYSMSPEQIKARPKLKPRAGSIFHNGERYTIIQFARLAGTGKDRVRALIKYGLEPSEIITTHKMYACSGSTVVGIKSKYVSKQASVKLSTKPTCT